MNENPREAPLGASAALQVKVPRGHKKLLTTCSQNGMHRGARAAGCSSNSGVRYCIYDSRTEPSSGGGSQSWMVTDICICRAKRTVTAILIL
jgi:hypothetical protein